MNYCLNPQCQKPQNPPNNKFCQNCGSKLLLAEQYRAIKPIGTGEFSRTFLGEKEPEKNRCVIKQFRSSALQPAEKFQQEMTRLQELSQHPQIAKLLAYFQQDNRQYLIEEFIEGKNLAQQMAEQGAFSEQQIINLLNNILPVLEFLHQGKLIHRDIKPEHLIQSHPPLTSPSNTTETGKIGEIVLVGFGAAKTATQTALNKTGTLIGSAEYAAPEQLIGKATFASDIYSLGVTCIHLLTQIHPFDLYDCTEGVWVWKDYIGNKVSSQFARLLDKMLHPTINRRYQSAEQVFKELNPGLKIPKYQIKIQPQITPEKPVIISPPSQTKTPSIPPIINLNQEPETSQEITPIAPPPPKPTAPLWTCQRTLTTSNPNYEITSIAFSPQSRILAGSSWDGTIKLWDLETNTNNLEELPLKTLTGHENGVLAIAITQDGQILASGSADCSLKIWYLWQLSPPEIRTNPPPTASQTLIGHTNIITSLAITSDRQIIVSGSRDKTIKLWQLKTGQLIQTLSGHTERISALIITPDNQKIISAGADAKIIVWQIKTGEILQTIADNSGSINTLTLTDDGKTLITGSWDRNIKIWNLPTGHLITTLSSHLLSISTLAIHPEGKLLASGSYDATIKLWNLETASEIATLSQHNKGITSLSFSPDGKTLASSSQDGTIKLWRNNIL